MAMSNVQVKEAESVYREVEENEYVNLVAARRGQADFVVDDGMVQSHSICILL